MGILIEAIDEILTRQKKEISDLQEPRLFMDKLRAYSDVLNVLDRTLRSFKAHLYELQEQVDQLDSHAGAHRIRLEALENPPESSPDENEQLPSTNQ